MDKANDQSSNMIIVLEDEIEDLVVDEAEIEVVGNMSAEVVEDRLPVMTRRIRHEPKPSKRLVKSREYLAWKIEA